MFSIWLQNFVMNNRWNFWLICSICLTVKRLFRYFNLLIIADKTNSIRFVYFMLMFTISRDLCKIHRRYKLSRGNVLSRSAKDITLDCHELKSLMDVVYISRNVRWIMSKYWRVLMDANTISFRKWWVPFKLWRTIRINTMKWQTVLRFFI